MAQIVICAQRDMSVNWALNQNAQLNSINQMLPKIHVLIAQKEWNAMAGQTLLTAQQEPDWIDLWIKIKTVGWLPIGRRYEDHIWWPHFKTKF